MSTGIGIGVGIDMQSFAGVSLPPIAGSIDTYGDSVMAIGVTSNLHFSNIGLAGGLVAGGDRITALSNYAVGGQTSSDLATQITGAGTTASLWAIIHVGSNDAFGAVPTATFMGNIRSACSTLKTAGKRVCVCMPIQRNDQRTPVEDSWNATRQAQLEEYWTALLSEPSGTWDFLIRTDKVPEWSSDGVVPNADVSKGGTDDNAVHPNPKGTYYIAKKVINTIAGSMLPKAVTTKATSSLAGTAGYRESGFTGSLASAWQGYGAFTGVTGTFSKPSATEQRITWSGTSTASEYGLILDATSIAATTGEVLRVRMDVRSSSLAGLTGFSCGFYNLGAAADRAYTNYLTAFNSDLSEFPPDIGGGAYTTIYSPWYTVPANEDLLIAITAACLDGATMGGTIDFTNVSVEKQ